jgi:hypothetical protein
MHFGADPGGMGILVQGNWVPHPIGDVPAPGDDRRMPSTDLNTLPRAVDAEAA